MSYFVCQMGPIVSFLTAQVAFVRSNFNPRPLVGALKPAPPPVPEDGAIVCWLLLQRVRCSHCLFCAAHVVCALLVILLECAHACVSMWACRTVDPRSVGCCGLACVVRPGLSVVRPPVRVSACQCAHRRSVCLKEDESADDASPQDEVDWRCFTFQHGFRAVAYQDEPVVPPTSVYPGDIYLYANGFAEPYVSVSLAVRKEVYIRLSVRQANSRVQGSVYLSVCQSVCLSAHPTVFLSQSFRVEGSRVQGFGACGLLLWEKPMVADLVRTRHAMRVGQSPFILPTAGANGIRRAMAVRNLLLYSACHALVLEEEKAGHCFQRFQRRQAIAFKDKGAGQKTNKRNGRIGVLVWNA
jgi:hypothetical protein